jgi:hypothetical protein
MSPVPPAVGVGTIGRSAWSASQWRLLLLWMAVLWLPTLVIAWPISAALGEQLDRSLLAGSLAQGFDTSTFGDLLFALAPGEAAIRGAVLASAILALLCSPLLTGMAITVIRGGDAPSAAAILQGGVAEYWKMLRMLLLALVLLAVAVMIGSLFIASADKRAERAITPADYEGYASWMRYAAIAVAALIHATIEAGRAQLAADPTRRSVVRAWGRGVVQLLRRPLPTLGFYILFSAVGYVLVAGLARWRISLSGTGAGGFAVAFFVTQLITIASAWMRTARLHALTEVAATSRRA